MEENLSLSKKLTRFFYDARDATTSIIRLFFTLRETRGLASLRKNRFLWRSRFLIEAKWDDITMSCR
jgi:hypothetical protein